jgi:hypothetical protein
MGLPPALLRRLIVYTQIRTQHRIGSNEYFARG